MRRRRRRGRLHLLAGDLLSVDVPVGFCGSTLPDLDAAAVFWADGSIACSGVDVCNTVVPGEGCGFALPTGESTFFAITPQEDQACRALIFDFCPVPEETDTDGDGAGDACDLDDDDDGVADDADNCPLDVNPTQSDLDGDHIGDVCDADLDGDGVANGVDNCPMVPNGDQLDFDADGEGDACDGDIDDDGVLNGVDVCAFTPAGEVVDPATGCSIAQLCPCNGPRGTTQPWKNHGQYVSWVAKTSQSFVKEGLITSAEREEILTAAAESSCGEK